MHKKKYKNMSNKQKKQNKIVEGIVTHKTGYIKVGVDSQFEGLEVSGLNNDLGQVIP